MTKWDKLLIVAVIILSISSIFIMKNMFFQDTTRLIRIEVDGELYKEIPMYTIMDRQEEKIETEYGYNIIEYDQDYIRVIDASCPDKLDVKQGKISEVGEMIICLPNRLLIEIKGQGESEIDKLTR